MLDTAPVRTSSEMVPRAFRVMSKRHETSDVVTLRLEPADGRSCFRFKPAQIGMVGLPGIGEVPISFSGHPDGSRCVSVTIREVGAVTRAIVTTPVNGLLSLRGPYGVPWPMHLTTNRDVVFMAGGLGLAPLRSAILPVGDEPEAVRSATVMYGAGTAEDFLFKDDLEIWEEIEGIRVLATVDEATPGWEGDVGLVTTLLDEAFGPLTDPIVFMCGPDAMMSATSAELLLRGVPAEAIWLTMERNMKCAIGLCGHCQFGPLFLCKDGPVFRFDRVANLFDIEEM